ncbi:MULTISPECIES: hypothetical protein [Elizabethkingia]|jgi:hypothetical protein|uniref:hypothetical protein n=1 Tax=Elizabethkingia TaxID=308865 RepID=UPI000B34AF71|nr:MULTISPECIES: hypothetical protein [Elizabethkingia]
MAELIDGLYLNTYVAPQLLKEFRNYNDRFMAALQPADAAAISADGIHFNKLINNVGFLVNNTNPFTPAAMNGKTGFVPWDKLDTTPTSCTDKEARALAFDKQAAVRVKQSQSFKIGVRDYVANKLAPAKNVSGSMPVLRTTGAVENGRKRLTFTDLLNFYAEIEKLNLIDADPSEEVNAWNMILNTEHRSDLLVDLASTNNHRGNIEFDSNTGELKRFYKIRMWENNDTPLYSATGDLKARGSVQEAGDQKASVFFYAPNTVYHLEKLMILYKPMELDTRNADPTSEIRLHAYGLCDKKQNYGFGALVSDNA